MDKIFSRNIVGSISILWIVFVFSLLIIKRETVTGLDLNEIGDFIAGTFAPLGFFWLVAGFYQQGKGLEQNSKALKMQATELKKTTEALELQVKEMRASVKQQSRLAQVYEDELTQKHFQVQPNLSYSFQIIKKYTREEPLINDENIIISSFEDKIVELKLVVKNLGEVARNLNIKSTTYPFIRRNESKFVYSDVLNINFEINGQVAAEITEKECQVTFLIEVTYQNVYGKKYRDHLTCVVESVYDYESNQLYLSPSLEKLHTVIF